MQISHYKAGTTFLNMRIAVRVPACSLGVTGKVTWSVCSWAPWTSFAWTSWVCVALYGQCLFPERCVHVGAVIWPAARTTLSTPEGLTLPHATHLSCCIEKLEASDDVYFSTSNTRSLPAKGSGMSHPRATRWNHSSQSKPAPTRDGEGRRSSNTQPCDCFSSSVVSNSVKTPTTDPQATASVGMAAEEML